MPKKKCEPGFAQKHRDTMVQNIDEEISELEKSKKDLEALHNKAKATEKEFAINNKNFKEKCEQIYSQTEEKTKSHKKCISDLTTQLELIDQKKKSLKKVKSEIKKSQADLFADDSTKLDEAGKLLTHASLLRKEQTEPINKIKSLLDTTDKDIKYMRTATESLKNVSRQRKPRAKKDDGSTPSKRVKKEEEESSSDSFQSVGEIGQSMKKKEM